MSRKNLLAGLGADGGVESGDVGPTPLSTAATPVAHLGKMLGAIRDRSERAQEIEKALSAGDRIVEIDPASIDPSPIADRLPASAESDAGLRDSIAAHGQRSPVLLRRDAGDAARFVTVYGHRRIAAARALGRKVKAIIADLDDEEAYVAQGVENAERRDLSYIERALFARRLTDAGVAANTVAAALGTARPNVVTMVTLCRRLPDEVILAIGPSPSLGRRRWEGLDARLVAAGPGASRRWRKAIAAPDFASFDADARFARIVASLSVAPEGTGAGQVFADGDGTIYGSMEKTRSGAAKLKLARDVDASFRADGTAFCDWLAGRMTELRASWRRGE